MKRNIGKETLNTKNKKKQLGLEGRWISWMRKEISL
jgi:hypothetical protein